QQDELLATVAGQHVAVAQAGTGHRGEGLQHAVAGGMAVQVVDALEMIQVDQRQAVLAALAQVVQLAQGQAQEVPAVEQPGQLVGGDQALELTHHAAQGVLVRLQRVAALVHALTQGLYIAGEQAEPDQPDEQRAALQQGLARFGQAQLVALPQVEPGEGEEGDGGAAHEYPRAQLEYAEHQDDQVEHQQAATRAIELGQQRGVQEQADQDLRLGQAGVGETQVAPAAEQG